MIYRFTCFQLTCVMPSLLLLCLVIPLLNSHQLPSESIKRDPNTVLVLWGTRHGNRHPENFLTENPRNYGFEGNLELTKFGKRQALGLGRELRKFVGDEYISFNYLPKEVKYYSSSANRCQMTLQTALAGLHRPENWGEWEPTSFDDWTPVPYTIDDPLLRMYAVENCPASDAAWKPISDDTWKPLKIKAAENKDLLQYIHNNTGFKATLSVAADIADNLIEIELYNASLPDWITNPTLKGYDSDSFYKKLLSFAECHQIACAEYAPCREMMGGYWVKHIFDSIAEAKKSKGPKVIGYASHTEVTLALMKLIGYERDELTTSAGFVIEFRNKPSPSLRLLNHDPNPIDEHVIYKAKLTPLLSKVADSDGFIPFSSFEKLIGNNRINDWENACDRDPSSCGVDSNPAAAEFIAPPATTTVGSITTTVFQQNGQEHSERPCKESDEAATWQCVAWADYGYCRTHKATKYIYCRHTCLCNPKYRPSQEE